METIIKFGEISPPPSNPRILLSHFIYDL